MLVKQSNYKIQKRLSLVKIYYHERPCLSLYYKPFPMVHFHIVVLFFRVKGFILSTKNVRTNIKD